MSCVHLIGFREIARASLANGLVSRKNQSPLAESRGLHSSAPCGNGSGKQTSVASLSWDSPGWKQGEEHGRSWAEQLLEQSRILSLNLEYVRSSLTCPKEAVGLFFV